MRVAEGPRGASPLRVLDLEHDGSLAQARVVWFSDGASILGYLGPTGDLLGSDSGPGPDAGQPMPLNRVVAIDRTTGDPIRTLFEIADGPYAAVTDRAGRHVLVLAGSRLYRWSEGERAATRLPGRFTFADWVP
jgi:hypothetical protein